MRNNPKRPPLSRFYRVGDVGGSNQLVGNFLDDFRRAAAIQFDREAGQSPAERDSEGPAKIETKKGPLDLLRGLKLSYSGRRAGNECINYTCFRRI